MGAEDGSPNHFVPASAQADEPENLALPNREAQRALVLDAKIADGEHGLRTLPDHRRSVMKVEIAPQHVMNDRLGCLGPDRARADMTAVAEYGDAIDQPEQLVEPMAHIENARAARAQPQKQFEQVQGVGPRQGGGGFVEDHDPGLPRERARDAQDRLTGRAERADRRAW